ncbi:MAG: ABC transporter ATP-binding protein [Lachnospiraceae bacterium]|nr:ABC transporter ATP-binding protein [Lachnospiraceae bacterium]
MLEIKNIKKSYGKHEVLKDINLKAEKGDCIAIAGLNGCGKSTLLSILGGTLKADAGEFIINGVNVMNDIKKKKGLIGYVPQENPLIDELSVRDNLRLWFCDSKLDMDEELDHGILKLLGVDEFVNKRVDRLSGGMKKRVSIGCSVAHDPAVLLLDEPSAALDLECKESIRLFLIEHCKRDGIVIMTTHDEAELATCNRLLVMRNGVLTEEDGDLRGAALLEILKNGREDDNNEENKA